MRSRRASSPTRSHTASASAAGSFGATASAASGVSTSRYPGMSDATAGSAHANARVSTMPKLSWPIDGATSAFERSSVAVSSSWLRKPTTSSPSSETRSRLRSRRTASGSAPATVRRSPVRRWMSGHARRSTWRPFRGSWRPAKTMRCSRSPAGADSGTSTPFGITSYSPGSQRFWDSRARSDTAMRWSMRSIMKPQSGPPYFIQPRSPDAWNVATIGQRARMSAVRQIVGVIGSCRWMTSKRSRSSARVMRKKERGESTMFGSEPFAGTMTERPTGITFGGGLP